MRFPSATLLRNVCILLLVFAPLAAGQNQPKFQILAQIPLTSTTNQSVTLNPAQPAGNPYLNLIYASGGATISPQQMVAVFDGGTLSSTPIATVSGSGAAVDINTDNYWAAEVCFPGCGAVLVYNSSNQLIQTVTQGVSSYCPVAVSLDDTKRNTSAVDGRRMWVGDQCGAGNDPVFVFNADTYALIAGPILTGGVFCDGPVVNQVTGRVYVGGSSSPGVCTGKRIDSTTFAITTTAFGPVLSLNPTKNLLYALSGNNLQIINGSSEAVLHTIALGYSPQSIADNDALGHLYLSNTTTNSIELRNDQTGQPILDANKNPITFPLGSGNTPGAVVADSLRGRISVIVYNSGNPSLFVIQDLSTVRNCSSAGGVCSNVGTGHK